MVRKPAPRRRIAGCLNSRKRTARALTSAPACDETALRRRQQRAGAPKARQAHQTHQNHQTHQAAASPASAQRGILGAVQVHRYRKARIWWSGWLIVSLLFMQLASAAYACPMTSTRSDEPRVSGMPCAMAMAIANPSDERPALDPEQPALCLAHCKGGSQTVDPGHTSSIAAPLLVALFVVTAAADASIVARTRRAQHGSSESAPPPPPHTILHCCFRI